MTERSGMSRRQALKYGGLAAAVPLLTGMRPAEKSRQSDQDGQDDWRWCDQCQGLWYAGNGTGGVCPAGGSHALSANGDNYVLDDDSNGGSHGGQDNWQWCDQCQGPWYAGNGTGGVCPAGGSHALSTNGNNYTLDNHRHRHHLLAGG